LLRQHQTLFHRAAIAVDVALVGLTVQVGQLLTDTTSHLAQRAGMEAAVLTIVWLVITTRLTLYESRRAQPLSLELEAILEAWIVTVSLGSVSCIVLWGQLTLNPFHVFMVGLAFLWLQRAVLRATLRRARSQGLNYRRVLLIGTGPTAAKVAHTLERNRQFGLRVAGSLSFSGEEPFDGSVHRLGDVCKLTTTIADGSFDIVLICPSVDAQIGEIQRVFKLCDEAGVQCQYMPGFGFSHLHSSVGTFAGLPTISFTAQRSAPLLLGIKRLLDITLSATALLVTMPFLLVIGLLIRREDGGPAIFRQVRVGQQGRPFVLYKFRTMQVDAERKKQTLLEQNEQKGPVFKMQNDPRVTRIGRWLRKYSLDELPQLVNVLMGHMSLVGPRPPTPDEVGKYEWWQRRRLSIRPGLTCIWQVFGRNRVTFQRWLEMDLYYIDNWSLLLDLKLLYRTVLTVAKGTGC
jgi:exopolysaccharide biosynthesis polyprenyl glycosylphosphotransferase